MEARKLDKNEILRRAFLKACKFLREHPPADTCEYIEIISLVYNGVNDPEGRRWAGYFVQQAIDELKEVEGNEIRNLTDN